MLSIIPLYALDARTGSERWNFTTGGAIDSSPLIADEVVYIGSQDGNVYTFVSELLWSYIAAGGIVSTPAVANGVVYIGSHDHSLYAFNQTYFWSKELGKEVE